MKQMNEKLRALLEVFIFTSIIIISFAVVEITIAYPYAPWIKKTAMIIIALLFIQVKGKRREYGLIPSNAKLSAKWSLIILLTFVIPAALSVIFFDGKIRGFSLLLEFIWFMIFTGFSEELAFRGYIQSRLNESFTQTYKKFMGFKVEWHEGTLIAGALIFGPIHLINAIDFKTGEVCIDATLILIVIFASFFGVLFGVIREICGDVIVCSALHGVLDFVAISLLARTNMGSLYWIPIAISFFVFFGFMFERLIEDFQSRLV